MKHNVFLTLFVSMLVLLTGGFVEADIVVSDEVRKGLQLTVYRNFGVVKDTRNIVLPKGVNRIRFEGVAASIQPSSVILEWPSKTKMNLLSQNYEFDLVSPTKLLEKYVGKELEIIPKKERWPDTSVQQVELISIDGEEPVFRIGTKITFGHIGQVLFPYMPYNLYTKPTLIWDIESSKRQKTDVSASYMADNISWDMNYIIRIGKGGKTGILSSWLTINNGSGLNFENVNVSVATGYPQRVQMPLKKIKKNDPNEKFHIFNVDKSMDIHDNQVKQIKWLPEQQVPLKRSYLVEFDHRDTVRNKTAASASYSVIVFENNKANGLGTQLPGGIVRVFRKSASGDLFMGEEYINAIPANTDFVFKVANAPEIVGLKEKVVQKKGNTVQYTYKLVISNNRNESIKVKVRDIIENGKIIQSSTPYKKLDSSLVEWNAVVHANGSEILTYFVQ